MKEINWRLFTDAEKKNITHFINSGNWSAIMSVVDNVTPEKELELQSVISDLQPKSVGFESQVAKKYIGVDITTPEQEAVIQGELEREYQDWLKKQEDSQSTESAPIAEDAEPQLTVPEVTTPIAEDAPVTEEVTEEEIIQADF